MVSFTGKRISSVSLFRQNEERTLYNIGIEHFIFVALYAVCLYYCYLTIGEQYVEALEKYEDQDINVADEFERLRNTAESFLAGKYQDSSTGVVTIPTSTAHFVPSKYSPGFWPSIALGLVGTLHALFILGQKWSIRFRCMVKFSPETKTTKATHAHVVPAIHQGKEQLVPLQRSKDGSIYFEYNRRKYLFETKTNSFEKVRCRSNYPIKHYVNWKGLPNESLFEQLRELYGNNRFQMAFPAFMDLYYEQVTGPFTVFQIFSTLLWCLDSYWQYSLFSFFMIFTFEATTVFSRLKSLEALKSMGNEISPVYVYRSGKWIMTNTEALVPGDLFSLVKGMATDVIPCDAILVVGGAVVNESTLTGESVPQMKDGIITACSASSKGVDPMEEIVRIKGVHKVNTLFGGTRLLQVCSLATKSSEEEEDLRDEQHEKSGVEKDAAHSVTLTQSYMESVPNPPDNGCICYCIRTGFCSSQGKLVRLIESSQNSQVKGDTQDGLWLLVFLLFFAIAASAYVLHRGMQDGTRSRYQLLLHCILIVTSVIPPELPMQTALAVNNSLMKLMQMQIFCTEPFRVPVAGKVDTCVFDKTGTLTTDELVAVGIVPPSTRIAMLVSAHKAAMAKMEEDVEKAREKVGTVPPPPQRTFFGIPLPTPMPPVGLASVFGIRKDVVSIAGAGMHTMKYDEEYTSAAQIVLGSCHSLVLIDNKLGGDPLEEASVKAIKWEMRSDIKDVARPAPEIVAERPFIITVPGAKNASSTYSSRRFHFEQAKILTRHHFSSKLQRMSVVVRLREGPVTSVHAPEPVHLVLVKGSPEMIGSMCDNLPSDYSEVSNDLAKRGMRVIALAWRRITSDRVAACCESRIESEKDLTFVGFVSFMCRVRKDSADIIHQLREGGNTVAMATGDALLTGVHVAKEVGITTSTKKGVLLLELVDNPIDNPQSEAIASSQMKWINFDTDEQFKLNGSAVAFDVNTLDKLSADYDLCTTGRCISYALDHIPKVGAYLHQFVVYARMRPEEKERVLLCMKDNHRVTLMCGDGANDVGALRQADVGIALLTGFGDLNGVKDSQKTDSPAAEGALTQPEKSVDVDAKIAAITFTETDEQLRVLGLVELHRRLRVMGIEPSDYPEVVNVQDTVKFYRKMAGEKAVEMKDLIRHRRYMKMTPQDRNKELARERTEAAQKLQEDFKADYERLSAAGDSWAMVTAMKNMWAKQKQQQQEMNEKNAKFNTLQGSAGQLAKALEGMENMEDLGMPMIKVGDASVASPFTSKMPSIRGAVDVIRQGRCTLVTTLQMYQILTLNCLISAYSLSSLRLDGIKYGDKQMTCLGMLMSVSFVSVSRSLPLDKLSPIKPLKSVFHPAYFFSICCQFALHLITLMFLIRESKKYLPEDYAPDMEGEFKQNIINSVVFLVTAVQQVSVFVVNLKGPPYMGGLSQNSPLLYSLVVTFIGVFMCASETVPQVNKWLQLEPFPTVEFRNMVLLVLGIDVIGAYIIDRLLLGIFAFPVLKASMEATTKQDMTSIARVILLISGVMYYLCTQDYTEFWEELERQMNETSVGDSVVASA